MENRMKMEFAARAENEAFARAAAAAFVACLDPTIEELTEIKTGVSEAVSNSIIHGYGEDPEKMVELECRILADRKVVYDRKAGRTFWYGIYGDGKLYGSSRGHLMCGRGNHRDDDQTVGCRRWLLNMSRLKKKIHTP